MSAPEGKILIVVDNDYPPDIRVENEILLLTQAGIKVRLLCFGFEGKTYEDQFPYPIKRIRIAQKTKNRLFFIAAWTPFYASRWSKAIASELKESDYDMLYVHDLYMIEGAQKAIRQARSKVKLVVDLHENFPSVIQSYSWTKGALRSLISRVHRWADKEGDLLRVPDHIVTLHPAYSQLLSTQFNIPIARFHSLANVPNVAQSREEIEWPYPDQHHFVFLYYGAIATRRGLFEFIEGFREVHAEIPDARLLIIGPVDKADKARFFTMIEDEELRDKILYIPWIAHKFSTQYIQKSDVCLAPFHVNPQHNSGVANKLYLYLQTGKFILASACKPQTALIQEFNAGHIFHDQEEMKREILWCATHKSEVLAMGQLAGAKFTESGYKEKNGNAYIATIKHWLH